MTPKPRFRGLVLDHQDLEELELKNHPKTGGGGVVFSNDPGQPRVGSVSVEKVNTDY